MSGLPSRSRDLDHSLTEEEVGEEEGAEVVGLEGALEAVLGLDALNGRCGREATRLLGKAAKVRARSLVVRSFPPRCVSVDVCDCHRGCCFQSGKS